MPTNQGSHGLKPTLNPVRIHRTFAHPEIFGYWWALPISFLG
ncbi:hypothetical protein [Moorena sp. SIOASIH]|nr:hypothetical protein [Moorena sp. SIOASIH]